MTKRRALWLVGVLLVIALAVLLTPRSPAYLPTLIEHHWHYHNGHSAAYWLDEVKSPDASHRTEAVAALGAMGPDVSACVPTLSDRLENDPDPEVRKEAALQLSKMQKAARPALPALIKAMKDDNLHVRLDAALALSALGPDAHDAVGALKEALKDDRNRTTESVFHITIQGIAAIALGKATANTDEGVEALTDALKNGDKDPTTRLGVIRGLAAVGPPAKPAVDELRKALNSDDIDIHRAAKDALTNIEGKAPEDEKKSDK
jgi:HEAT repeat protein